MLWCAVCCEPYHPFCLQADDLPLTWNGNVQQKHTGDWICRRCTLCKVCGQPGDAINIEQEISLKDSTISKTGNLSNRESKSSITERKRLKCMNCACVFHSDCLQPSQQKIITAQGSKWVRNGIRNIFNVENTF